MKIIFPDIATAPRFTLDRAGFYGSHTTYFIAREDLYLLALLNSRFSKFYFVQTCSGLEGAGETYLRFFGQYLEGFPIRKIEMSNPAETGHDRTNLHPQIDATDAQVDQLVYELYELTNDEIKVVEAIAKPHSAGHQS